MRVLVTGAAVTDVIPCSIAEKALGIIAVSVLLHAGYKIGLASVYGASDLGQAYPVVRGVTPVAAAALGFALLGERPGAPQLAGIGLVSAGILASTAPGSASLLPMVA